MAHVSLAQPDPYAGFENVAFLRYHQRGSLESTNHILRYRLIFLKIHTGYTLMVFIQPHLPGWPIKFAWSKMSAPSSWLTPAVGLVTDSQYCKPWAVYWYTVRFY